MTSPDETGLEPKRVGNTDAEYVLSSIAISLKRLADVAEAWASGSFNYPHGGR